MADGATKAVKGSDVPPRKGNSRGTAEDETKAASASDAQSRKGKSRAAAGDEAEAAADGDPQPGKGNRRKWLMVGAVVALSALGSSGITYLYASRPAAESTKTADPAPSKVVEKTPPKPVEKAPQKPMLYVPMETFTVNLLNVEQERYLQVTINLEVADAATVDAFKDQMPSVRNRVLLLLSSKEAGALMTRDGKEKLAAEIAAELRKTLGGSGKGLEQVLFSHFVIQ